ncbi:MAG: hypothetical protein GX801_03270 [Fibrobacter sp.]|nr:hypothetical protein [Fibrobacter sp.]
MLTWISENAKWVIYIFIVFILAGLLFMDMSSLQNPNSVPVGKINGKPIFYDQFQTRLQQVQYNQNGQNLSEEQMVQLRKDIFEQIVQEHVFDEQIRANQLEASVVEMHSDLRLDPPPGLKDAPIFQTDSAFDQAKYDAWLATDSIYDDPQILQYEFYLKSQKVPLKQLQIFVGALHHPSTLESQWVALNRELRADLWVAATPTDSFAVENPDKAAMQAYFDAHKDSFHVEKDYAQIEYVSLPIVPSVNDDSSARSYAQVLLNQINDGASFAEIAAASSEDELSAEQGGEINLEQWGQLAQETVRALDSGAISEVVRTPFGWHIFKSLGAVITGDDGKVAQAEAEEGEGLAQLKAAHVLIKVTPSTETIDSLEQVLQKVKDAVEQGADFTEVATENQLEVEKTSWIGKGEDYSKFGHLSGLQSYLFRHPDLPKNDEVTSNILHNKEVVVLAHKVAELKGGERSFDYFSSRIEQNILEEKKMEAAIAYLQTKVATIKEISEIDSITATPAPFVSLEAMERVGVDGYVQALGYATPVLHNVVKNQKVGEWGEVLAGNRNAAMVKVLNRTEPDSLTLQNTTASEKTSAWMQGAYSLFNDWLVNKKAGLKVQNNLDMFFTE